MLDGEYIKHARHGSVEALRVPFENVYTSNIGDTKYMFMRRKGGASELCCTSFIPSHRS